MSAAKRAQPASAAAHLELVVAVEQVVCVCPGIGQHLVVQRPRPPVSQLEPLVGLQAQEQHFSLGTVTGTALQRRCSTSGACIHRQMQGAAPRARQLG